MTYNLYMGQGGLFEPWFHNFFGDGRTTGRSAGEFPLLYWLVAGIWKLTGPREDVYRLVMLLLHFGGTWALYRGFLRLLGHGGWAVLVALLFFASPVMAYFSVGFLPDVPAYDLALIGCWVLFRRHPRQPMGDVAWAAVLFALAGLIKATALMGPMALCGWLVLEQVKWFRGADGPRLFPRPWPALLCMGAAFAVVFAWYAYMQWYNGRHGATFSNQAILPIWTHSAEAIRRYFDLGRHITVMQVFDTPVWYAFLAMSIYLLWVRIHVFRPLAGIFILLLMGSIGYLLLWWEILDGHEYYLVVPMVMLIALVALFLDTLHRRHPAAFRSYGMLGGMALLVAYSVLYAANNHKMRTRGNGPLTADMVLPLYHAGEIAHWDLIQHWGMSDMLDIEPYNRSIGIRPDDLVINVDDRSVCAALYLMRQRGWVRFGQAFESEAEVQELIDLGASYLFVVDPEWLDKPHMQRFYRYPIGSHRSVRIYDLRPFQGPGWRAPFPWGAAPRPL
ncbi:MAG: glycosyltransferase family 39 protein [Flavobacteriales bacterium]|nr:glycosyltransferase family 39 protein [Flavobacteriales bacterium]